MRERANCRSTTRRRTRGTTRRLNRGDRCRRQSESKGGEHGCGAARDDGVRNGSLRVAVEREGRELRGRAQRCGNCGELVVGQVEAAEVQRKASLRVCVRVRVRV